MRRNNCWLAVLAFSTALPILRHGSARERVPVVDGSQVAHSEVPYFAKQSSSGPEAVDETGAIFPEETVSHPSRTNEPDNNDNNNHPANRVANRNPALAWHASDHTNLRDHVRGNDDQFENVRNPDAGFKENFPGLDESQAPKDRAEGTNRSLARINETQELDRASQAATERRLSPWIHRDTVNVSPGTAGDVIHRDQEIFRRASSRKRGVDWGNDRRGSRGSLVQPGNQYFGHVGSSSRDDDSVTSSRGDAERKAGFETSGRVAGDIPGGIDVRLVGSSGVEARISGGRTVNDEGQFRGGVNNILESSKRTFKTVEKTVDQQQQYSGSSRSKSAEAFETSDEELAENDHQFSDIKRPAGKEDQLQFSDPKSPTEGTIQLFKESSTINLDEGLQLLEFMRPAKEEPKAFRPSEKEIDVEHRLKPSETLKNSKKGLKIADPELSFSRPGQKTSLYSLMTIKRRHRRNTESSSDPHEAGIKSSESRSPFDPGWNRSPTGMKNEERASEEELVVPTSCKSAGTERAYVPGVSSQQRSTVNIEDNGGGALCSRNFFREQKSTPIVESPTIVGIRSAPDPVPNRKNEELGTSDTIDNGFDGIGDGDASSNEFLASLTVTRSDLADPTVSVKEPWIGKAALIAPVADRGYRSNTSSDGNEDLRAEKVAEGDGDSDPDDGRDCEDKNAKLSGPNDRDKDNRLPRTDRSNYSSNEDCADRGIEGCLGRVQGEYSVGDAALDDLKLNGHDGGDKDKVDRYAESYDTDGVLLDSKHESFQENYGSRRVDGRGFDGQRGGEQSKQSAVNGALVYALNQDKGDDVGVTKVDYGSSRKDNRQSSVVSNNGKDKQGASNNESVYSTIQDKEMGIDAKILNYEKKRKDNVQLSEQSDNDKNNRGMSAYSLNYGKEDDVAAQKLEYSSNREDNDFSEQDNLGEDNRGTLKDEFAYSMSQDKEKGSEEEVLHNGSSHKENGDSSGQMINGKDNRVISKDGGVYSISRKEEKDVIGEQLLNSENYQGNVRLNGQSDSDKINRVASNKGVKPKKSNHESHRKDNDYFSGHNDSNKNNEEILKEGFVYSSNRNKEKRVEPNKLDYGSNSETNAQLKNKSDSANDNQTAPNNKPPHSTNPTEQTNTKPKKLDYMITHVSYTEPNNAKHTQTPPNTDLPHLETLNIEPVITAKRLSTKDSPRSDKSVEEARAHLIDSYNEKLIGRLTGEAADNLDIVKPGIPGPATNNRNNDAADKRRPGRVHRDKTAKKAFSSTSSMKGSTSKDMTKESGNASTNSERGSPAVGRNSAYLANDMNTPTAERASNVVENDGKSAGDRSARQGKAAVGRPRNSHPETASHEPTVINYADNEKKGARSISLAPDFDDVNERTRVIGTERSRDSTNRNSGRDDGRNGPDFEDVNPRGAGKQSAGLMEDQLRPRKERRSSVRSGNPDTGDLHPGTGSNGIDVASNVTSLKIDSGGSSVPGPISLDRPPGFISGEDRSVPSESYESVSTFSDVSWTDQDLDVSSLTTDDLERSLEIDSTVGSLENDDYSRLDDELAGSENASAHDQERPNLWPVKHSAVVEGDLVLGGLMMVHEREDTITCGPVMPQGGVQALEAMLYTLDWLNEQEIVPGVKIGAHILDDCDKDTYGLEMAVDFIKGRWSCLIRVTERLGNDVCRQGL